LAPPFSISSSEKDRIAIVLLGHGSREPRANADFEQLAHELQRKWPSHPVVPAYIELAQPSLASALEHAATLVDRVVVLPCFLFTAGHIKNDLPLELLRARRANPKVEFLAGHALGVHPAMIEAALDRLQEAQPSKRARTAIIVVGRGSSDPDANGDFAKLVRLIGEGSDSGYAMPAFVGITRPSFEEALELAARTRPDELVVLPYFLFAGRLTAQLADKVAEFTKRHPWIGTRLASPLGLHHGLLRTLDERLRETVSGVSQLPCDNCQYRVPMAPAVNNVGGLKALLWSVRHMTTHSQAMPHIHAHRSMRKHVLVCGNADCASRGSVLLIGALRRLIRSAGQAQGIRITKTGCMGRCGEGPTVAVYPDGIWYRTVTVADAPELVQEHFLNDRLVARLIDAIMQ
jgi:sirohydrochlorin cobaltochelatase